MRKLIMIAAMSLLATQAFAGGSRSLSLAATNASQQRAEPPAATVTPQATQAPAAAPSANVQTATTTPASDQPAAAPQTAKVPAATRTPVARTSEVAKPKRRQLSDEARLIRELQRHGIYW
ncbi:hypothetical protein AC629_26745 [Bradyrhizobium sp. NAS80.1]|uniref:hypothetical protein n=1 Tax=Bradyrhizobium sp. NAS80.1 TaxID=1680159 RepID=UPI000969D48D|nr:hypothetical protein [Bradyrhizobium sp. NAS80.1]OKO80684.1 hypothetical protein AC629_26745 [Bradyrhizobium sp. NAS80.1]